MEREDYEQEETPRSEYAIIDIVIESLKNGERKADKSLSQMSSIIM